MGQNAQSNTSDSQAPIIKTALQRPPMQEVSVAAVSGINFVGGMIRGALVTALVIPIFAIFDKINGLPLKEMFKGYRGKNVLVIGSIVTGVSAIIGYFKGHSFAEGLNEQTAKFKPYIESVEAERDDLRSALHAQRVVQERSVAAQNVTTR